METATSSLPLHHRIRHLLFRLPMLIESLIRHFTFIKLKEYYLSLFFFNSGLFPLTIDLDRDTSIHLWIPTHRNHRRIPLLLIHGFGGNSKWQWQKQIVSLSKSFDLYIPDLIFFGRSTTLSSDRSVEFQAQCFVETMRRLGVDKYAVCGFSYGGFVAFRMADMAVKEVEKLVILTAGVCMTDKQKKEMVEREERDAIQILLPQKGEDLMELLRRSMYRPPRWVPAFLLRDFIEVKCNF
ncbi:hypothetical protein ZOSMA_240G00210 [Zostera marina]|uniref:AB hydrolase-1 domain-containing protein n=1 Tax=Zostera marina TaxID=29655 RepID=A0A0K9PH06_ZOSMR|nr:hypothetical protein ZOSMA_240G00210 [Zostera marina]